MARITGSLQNLTVVAGYDNQLRTYFLSVYFSNNTMLLNYFGDVANTSLQSALGYLGISLDPTNSGLLADDLPLTEKGGVLTFSYDQNALLMKLLNFPRKVKRNFGYGINTEVSLYDKRVTKILNKV